MEIYNGHDYTIYEKENEDFVERISYLEATYHAPFTFGIDLNKLNFKCTFRRPNVQVVHVPLSPDLARMVKVASDHFENLTNVFCDAKNGDFS